MALQAKHMVSIALSALSLASVPAANGQTADSADWSLGGGLDLTFGFKPQFVEADGAGNYRSATATVTAKQGAGLSLALQQGLVSVDEPAKETALTDPVLAATVRHKLESLGLGARAGVSLSPGVSLASRDADTRGTGKLTLGLAKNLGELTLSTSVVYSRKMHRYTRAASGRPNDNYTLTGSIAADYAATSKLSVNLSLAYAQTKPLAGDERNSYSNGFGIGYQLTDAVSLATGVSTSDAQLSPGGDDNNEFTLYKRNQTEMYVSATYAF